MYEYLSEIAQLADTSFMNVAIHVLLEIWKSFPARKRRAFHWTSGPVFLSSNVPLFTFNPKTNMSPKSLGHVITKVVFQPLFFRGGVPLFTFNLVGLKGPKPCSKNHTHLTSLVVSTQLKNMSQIGQGWKSKKLKPALKTPNLWTLWVQNWEPMFIFH